MVEFGVDLVGIELTQCSGFMTFWYGSGSADLKHWIPDPDLFLSDFQDANKSFFLLFTTKSIHESLKITSYLKSHKTVEIKYSFCLLAIESGSVQTLSDPGGLTTYGSYGFGS